MTLKQRWQNFRTGWYEDGDEIVSRNYGRYPKNVPYYDGVKLYPGQSTTITIKIGINREGPTMPQGPQGKA